MSSIMRNIKTNILAAAFTSLFTIGISSCSDFLEELPKTSLTPGQAART